MSNPQDLLNNNPGLDTKHDSAGAKHPDLNTAGGNPKTNTEFEYAPESAHSRLDGKDQRTHGSALADAKRVEELEKKVQAQHEEALKHPTSVATQHGNEPSRGAKKDEQLVQDEEEELKKKDEAKKQSQEAHKSKHH
ncbi:hypothetical protein L202_04590 [Cryptococcus amylolentus CBS 6039]|uniref:Uncharacterized protein n=2 Tax=Cryptococcus amylolentus TaxID=104669 RepID=A0A1E3HM48_9TREE|nr:hypothetical protein L202_04590 [Cryptococcus amylolentus CBS 6039]ODN77410.1 hypothetical protein L202_04590 [Cryptococcus amylolentus CBS 6039]ODO05469.1 hypothetical protein I350_04519 [Cryptococcus amylolentus CBS 6273]